ncbi:MAG: 2-oxoacid:ferredoxin oxidoreductase subunit beta [Armatimonadetes bacterium]|nr:2-oxoacid:ferredoxin oxidoreductase subunit beta [Armatimonadota bacterium]
MAVGTEVRERYKSDLKPIWCPGCGDYGVLTATFMAFGNLGLKPEEVVIISGIGCSGRFPAFTTAYGFHSLHGRTMPVALGVKAANPNLTVIAVGGDGDTLAIGGNHFMHACRRNINLTYLLLDNNLYALTKGQASPTTLPSQTTDSTPYGSYENYVEPCALAILYGATFVAREFSARARKLADVIAQAIQHPGFSLVHILSPCVTFFDTYDFYKQQVKELPQDYDQTDMHLALKYATDMEHRWLGILYRTYKPTFEERVQSIKEKAMQRYQNVTLKDLLNRRRV